MDAGTRFMELHRSGTFVLVNVADAGTARAVADAGALAVATTSAGHATTLGREDTAGDVTMEEHATHTGCRRSPRSVRTACTPRGRGTVPRSRPSPGRPVAR